MFISFTEVSETIKIKLSGREFSAEELVPRKKNIYSSSDKMLISERQYGGYGGYVECCDGVVDPLFLLTVIAGRYSLGITGFFLCVILHHVWVILHHVCVILHHVCEIHTMFG